MICNFRQHFAGWRRFDPDVEHSSADNPDAPFCDDQRRSAFPLPTLAFGWRVLITGLMADGAFGNGLAFGGVVCAFKAVADV